MSSIFGNLQDGLRKLMQALQAIEPAPNDQTVYFNDQVYCHNPNVANVDATYASDEVVLNDNGEEIRLTSNFIEYTAPGQPPFAIAWSFLLQNAPTLEQVLAAGNAGLDQVLYINSSAGPYSRIQPSEVDTVDPAMGNSTVGAGFISLLDNTNSKTVTIQPTTGIQWVPNPWSGSTTYNEAGLTLNGADYNTNFTVSGTSIEKPSSTQMTYYIDYMMAIFNSTVNFKFSNDHKFFKWDAGTSLRVNSNDTHVERDHAFKVSDDGTDFNFNAYTDYLDDSNKPGWTVILSNCHGSDIAVNSPDVEFYSHGTGPAGTSISLKKWATARFTLVPTNTFSYGYAWAVSMY